MQETLQTMMMMEMTKRLRNDSEIGVARGRAGSIEENISPQRTAAQSKFNILFHPTDSISKELIQNISAQMGAGGKSSRAKSGRRRLFDEARGEDIEYGEKGVNITRVLLTGGPCAGKTTALAAISQDLTQLGYKVLVVPEAATMIMKGGAMIVSSDFTEQQGLMFQKSLMRLQIALEDTFLEIAQMIKNQPVVLLIDRGLLDGSAYVSESNW